MIKGNRATKGINMFLFTKFQHARPSREKTIKKNRTGNLVYAVSHKLLAQVTPEIQFALKGGELQRKHNIFMSDRGTVVIRGDLWYPGVLGQHVVFG